MRESSAQFSYLCFEDASERIQVIFRLLLDLTEDQNELEKELLRVFDETIEKIPLFEVPEREDIEALEGCIDFTDQFEITKGKGCRVILTPKKGIKNDQLK